MTEGKGKRKSKSSGKEQNQKDRLVSQLEKILPDIDEEGLLFLIRQANTLIYNNEVDRLNTERAQSKQSTAPKKSGGRSIDIELSPDKKTYYLIIDGMKHFLDVPEMQKVVKLCYAPPRKSDALKYLFQFFDSERKEILMDHGISSAANPFFDVLFKTTRSMFTLK